jgi:hypothetical protein
MMAEKVGEDVLTPPGFGERRNVKMHLGAPAFIDVEPGKGGLAGESAGNIEEVSILVGTGTYDRVIVGDGVGFAHGNMFAECRAAV